MLSERLSCHELHLVVIALLNTGMHVRAASANVVMDTITHQSLIILHIVIAVREPATCDYSCHDCDGSLMCVH